MTTILDKRIASLGRAIIDQEELIDRAEASIDRYCDELTDIYASIAKECMPAGWAVSACGVEKDRLHFFISMIKTIEHRLRTTDDGPVRKTVVVHLNEDDTGVLDEDSFREAIAKSLQYADQTGDYK